MSNTALQRLTQAILTNKSGGSVAQGDVVIVDSTTAASFTTTTTSGFVNGIVGVIIEPNGIANNAMGMVAFAGPIPKINLSAAASLGDLFKTHTVAKQAVRHAAPIAAGDFGIVLGTGTNPAALLWGLPAGATGAGSGDVVGPGSAVDGGLALFDGTTGKLIKDGGVLASGKVVRTAGDITTTSTSFVDATSLSVTITTKARRCLVTFTAVAANNTAADTTQFDLDIDGSRVGQTYGLTMQKGTNVGNVSFAYITDALTAASHTFKIQWRVDAGTGTLYASTTIAPAILAVVELP